MEGIFRYEASVTDEDIDRQRHVSNIVYVRWMQEAAVAHSSAQGWSGERYDAAGVAWVAKSHRIEYVKPAFAQERIAVYTWVAGFKRASSVRRYRIVRQPDDAVLAIAETNWAFVSLTSGLPTRIPQDVLDCFPVVFK